MPDKFPKLKPAFIKNGTITAANASKLNDGASCMILASEKYAKEKGLQPLARVVSYADGACLPIDFAVAPAIACQRALEIAGLKMEDIAFHEVNEAFASVPIANARLLGINPETVNIFGGACALGHPIGMSGNRIILTLINVLRKQNARYGMASICNGGGGASAIIIERL